MCLFKLAGYWKKINRDSNSVRNLASFQTPLINRRLEHFLTAWDSIHQANYSWCIWMNLNPHSSRGFPRNRLSTICLIIYKTVVHQHYFLHRTLGIVKSNPGVAGSDSDTSSFVLSPYHIPLSSIKKESGCPCPGHKPRNMSHTNRSRSILYCNPKNDAMGHMRIKESEMWDCRQGAYGIGHGCWNSNCQTWSRRVAGEGR